MKCFGTDQESRMGASKWPAIHHVVDALHYL